MHHYSSVQKNSKLNTTSEAKATITSEALQIQQLTSALWLERCSNQIQRRIQDCLIFTFSNQSKAIGAEASIFQTVIKELSVALGTNSIVIALADTENTDGSPTSEPAFQICYVAPAHPQQLEQTNLPAVVVATGKTIELKVGTAIVLEDLQQLQTQRPQSAWPLHDDQDLLGWLISSTSPPPSNPQSLEALRAKLQPQLVERTARQCAIALAQLRRLQAALLRCQNLEARSQELVRANQLKSEFLANTSHEIRTPLSSILGFTHLLQAQAYNPSNLRHQEYLNIILSSGQHLLAVINDILDLSKIEANQLEVHWEPVAVPDLCRSVLTLVKEKASDKGLELRLDLDPLATTIVADSLRLKQMLFNLLSNGLKFTSQGTVGLQVKCEGVFVHFTVWDTGTGISKEQQHQLFQPYSQIANSVVGRQEGTGLGLALSQKLAELHGGWVKVQSELNQGSQFTIVLPLTPAVVDLEWESRGAGGAGEQGSRGAGEQGEQGERGSRGAGGVPVEATGVRKLHQDKLEECHSCPVAFPKFGAAQILLVEDHLHNAKLISTYLTKFGGYQVTWVKNAAQMWQALAGLQPALILMDIHLPDINGLTLLQQLQAQEQYRKIPVIAQTAMAMKGDRETCLAAGAMDYISKPIDLPFLATLVSKYSNTRAI